MSKQSAKSTESRVERQPERDPLSPFGHTMIELFHGPFEGIRFPDVDRQVLEESRDALIEAQLRLELTEKQLELARANVRDASASFTQCAGRALAYMRVYAMGQPQLEELLANAPALTNPLAGAPSSREGEAKPEEKRKRGRPRKVDTAALLPMSEKPSAEKAVDAALVDRTPADGAGEEPADDVVVAA